MERAKLRARRNGIGLMYVRNTKHRFTGEGSMERNSGDRQRSEIRHGKAVRVGGDQQ